MERSNDNSDKHSDRPTFVDNSTECAICLQPLDGERVLKLSCGHRWHSTCLREQLEHAQPTHSRRLLFSGCRCAKCGVFCEHDELADVTRRTDQLRAVVDQKIIEQWQVEAPCVWAAAQSVDDKNALIEEGRRKYAFYLCNSCEEPYFGGTVECAEQDEGELVSPQDRLCPSCAPQPQTLCRFPHLHRGAHVWKCRYCCRPAVYVCYGTVHFCQECHDRNSARVHQQRGVVSSDNRPRLEPIPCPGETCILHPKPQGEALHRNGPQHDCEQVFSCVWCTSGTADSNAAPQPGSRNLVVNPSGAQGPSVGWTHLSQRRTRWQVETSDLPLSSLSTSENGETSTSLITTNFVSTFAWCHMVQRVHLPVRNVGTTLRVEVAACFRGRTDCPSSYSMQTVLWPQRTRQVRSGLTSADAWERVSILLEVTNETRAVDITVSGKDNRFWAGLFGAKVCDISLRILGTAEERAAAGVREQRLDQRWVAAMQRIMSEHFVEVVLPVILLLVWMMCFA